MYNNTAILYFLGTVYVVKMIHNTIVNIFYGKYINESLLDPFNKYSYVTHTMN